MQRMVVPGVSERQSLNPRVEKYSLASTGLRHLGQKVILLEAIAWASTVTLKTLLGYN